MYYYLKAFFFNSFIVFFANYILPGIEVASITKLPTVGSDVIFAMSLGFINTLIYPMLKLFRQATGFKIGGLSLGINLVAYAILKIVPIGIHITTIVGYFAASLTVAVVSFLIAFLEMRRSSHHNPTEGIQPAPEFHDIPPQL